MKNSPFGKRLRASHKEAEDESTPRKDRINPIFGVGGGASSSTPTLDSRPTTGESSGGPKSPMDFYFGSGSGVKMPRIAREYGDRFIPSQDVGDLRTSYHLMDEGGPSTPSKNRIIPSESDAQKGPSLRLCLSPKDIQLTVPLN